MLNFIFKVRVHCEELLFYHSVRRVVLNFLSVLERRGLRVGVPSYLFSGLNSDVEVEADELGSEGFLVDYILPASGKCFVDVGASFGIWSLYVANRGFAVASFEPCPDAFKILKANMAGFSGCMVYSCAVGEKDGVAKLAVSDYVRSGSISDIGIDVSVKCLDNIKLKNVGVIKVDTEGFEVPVLLGAKNIIELYRPRLVVEIHRCSGVALDSFEGELKRILVLLRGFGYNNFLCHVRRVGLFDYQPHIIAEHV